MSDSEPPAYGLWPLVIMNAAVFILFAFSFFRPRTGRDWRSFGAFSAFIVALFAEMYGFPLTIYLLSGWLVSRNPNLNLLSHDAGHLWTTIFGLPGDPHFSILHIVSYGFIGLGFVVISAAWRILYLAQRTHRVAQSGPYAVVRHPQYIGFILIMVGFLFQWPTVITLIMFPILTLMYARLARREEKESLAEFGNEYAQYMASTPAFIPRIPRLLSQLSKGWGTR
jgi:protein-S-isoprenylcysteine O-methyltransferase Ste14